MRNFSLLGASALVALSLAGSAMAADDPMAGAYGNTVVVTNEKGEATKLWIAKDGTFKVEAGGKTGTGKWVLKDGNKKYCSTADLPAGAPAGTAAPKEACSDFAGAHKAGDKWQQKDADGKTVTVEIKAGA
jgi:hypothetical protein